MDKYDLNLYLKSIEILRRVEAFLDDKGLESIHRRNLIFYLCMYATRAKAGSAYAPPGEILKLEVSTLSTEFLDDCYDRISKLYEKLASKLLVGGERDYDSLAKGPQLVKAVDTELKRRFHAKKKAAGLSVIKK
jgi:hypothetical protein